MADFGDFRKPRSLTASNIDETIFEIPEGRTQRASSVLQAPDPETHGSSRRLSNPFTWKFRKPSKAQGYSTTSLAVAQKSNTVSVARPVFTQEKFDDGFEKREPEDFDFKGKIRKCFTCDCSKKCWKDFAYRLFPFITIMSSYSPREDLSGDVIAGLTVGIMNIPQGNVHC